MISFTLPEVSDVVIRLIDIQGREVLQLQERAVPAGDYNFRNSKVSQLPEGIYVIKVETEKAVYTSSLLKN